MKNKNSRIEIDVALDEQNLPESIRWTATDQANPSINDCKAMFLSFFEKESLDTLKIDLWTKEMQIVEMDRFIYFTLRSLADTYFRATNNQALANEMRRFVQYFGEKTEIIPSEN